MIFTTLLTDDFIGFHKIFIESMLYFNEWFEKTEHIILYKKGKLTKQDFIKKYLKNVKFVEVPEDFLQYRDVSKNLYPHFAMTYDKLYFLFLDEIKGKNVVLYDADMICLKSFYPEFSSNKVLGGDDPTSKINTGYVTFGMNITKNIDSAKSMIEIFSEDFLQLPDQEIINTVFPCENFRRNKILNSVLNYVVLEDLKKYDILHYITTKKNIAEFCKKNKEFLPKFIVKLVENNINLSSKFYEKNGQSND